MNTFINNQRLAELAGVNYDSEIIQAGPIVYSRTHLVVSQFPRLRGFPSCVLVTSFSDASVTDEMARDLPPNVRHWFSNNVETTNPRVTAVPLGLRLSPEGERYLRAARRMLRPTQRNLLYLNCWRRLRRTPNPRRGIYEQFGGKEWITVEGGFIHVPIPHFYQQTASHPYILSPPGAGPDCHRHWEALLLGSIPVVLKSPALRILDDLPCLQVDSWQDVTPERLMNEFHSLKERFQSPAMDKLWFEYWRERILNA